MSVFNFRYWLQLSPKDWVLRMISLGLAIVLWYFVGGEDIVNKNIMVPVEVINMPRDLVVSNQFKKEIEVSVSGPRSMVLIHLSHSVCSKAVQSVPDQMDFLRATVETRAFTPRLLMNGM